MNKTEISHCGQWENETNMLISWKWLIVELNGVKCGTQGFYVQHR